MADIKTRRLLRRTLGSGAWPNVIFTLWPITTGPDAVTTGVFCQTGGGAAWGAWHDIIAANAIPVEFYLMQVMYDSPHVAPGQRIVRIQNATLGTVVFWDSVWNAGAGIDQGPTTIPIPIWCNANDQIQASTMCPVGWHGIGISLLVATGL